MGESVKCFEIDSSQPVCVCVSAKLQKCRRQSLHWTIYFTMYQGCAPVFEYAGTRPCNIPILSDVNHYNRRLTHSKEMGTPTIELRLCMVCCTLATLVQRSVLPFTLFLICVHCAVLVIWEKKSIDFMWMKLNCQINKLMLYWAHKTYKYRYTHMYTQKHTKSYNETELIEKRRENKIHLKQNAK